MNIFTAKKKPKTGMPWDESIPDEQLFPPSNHPTQRRAWGRKKIQPEAAPPPVAISTLPSPDDFRTSLLMPNLSARFSMLRDQDNPHSVLGKASDDSVLQAHRRSRLYQFGHNAGGLMDIAEISSGAEPITTPSVTPRKGSYTYGQGPLLDDGASIHSIMDRSRQGQGNTLFGGRQRTFKAKKIDNGPETIMGRRSPRKSPRRRAEETSAAVFRKIHQEERQRERDKAAAQLTRGEELAMDDDWTIAASEFFSPSGHDEKRASISSTTSGPSRISLSTAATTYSPSVSKHSPAMPSIDRPALPNAVNETFKSPRTYEQGLAQYRYDQQAAALTRLNSVKHLQASTRARTPMVPETQPVTNPNDQMEKPPEALATTIKTLPSLEVENSREAIATTNKPLPALEMDKLTTFDSIRRTKKPIQTPDVGTLPVQPLSPFDEESDSTNVLYRAIDPNDRGKATATGLFRKPSKFDEKQYLQRQLSIMQQQRKKRRSVLSPTQMKPTFPGESISPTKSQRPRPAVEARPRADTDRSDRSWEGDRDESTAFTTMRKDPLVEGVVLPSAKLDQENNHIPIDTHHATPRQHSVRESLEALVSDRALREIATPPRQTPAPTIETERPETWSASSPKSLREKRNGWSPDRLMTTMAMAEPLPIDLAEQDMSRENDENLNPVPEKAQVADLKGLVRAHLRQVSNVSSICPSPGNKRPISQNRVPSIYNADNTWDPDAADPLAYRGTSRSHTPTHGRGHLSPTSANSPAKPTLQRLVIQEKNLRVDSDVEREVHRQHARGGSTETQHERQAFARELVERQRAIQENLRIKVENENRSPSPTNANKNVFEHHFKPFGVLRAMSSRESINKTQEPLVRPYKWVDMSAGDGETSGKAHNGPNTITIAMRDISPTTGVVGRTLHSRLRETTSPKASEIQSKRTGPGVGAEIRPGPFAPASKQQDAERHEAFDMTSDSNQSRPSTAAESGKASHRAFDGEMSEQLARKSGESVAVSTRQPQSLASTTRSRNGTSESKASIAMNHATVQAANSKETPRKQAPSPDTSPAARIPETPSTVSSNPASASTSHWRAAQTPQSAAPSTGPSSAFSSAKKDSDVLPMPSSDRPTPIVTTISRPQHNLFPTPSSNLPNAPKASPSLPPHSLLPLATQYGRGPNLNWTHPANRPRKYHGMAFINKSDISEPTLIASTSSADTVALPEGASLKNGMAGEADVVLAGGGVSGYWAGRSMDVGGVGKPVMERREKEKDRRGFLARVGRVGSGERKAERERERAMQARLQNMI